MTTPLPPHLAAGMDQARAELAELVRSARAHHRVCDATPPCPGTLVVEVPGHKVRLLFALAINELANQPERTAP